MEATAYVNLVKDRRGAKEKLPALREAASLAEQSGNFGLFMLATARIRQWEAMDRNQLPLEGIVLLNHVAQQSTFGAETVALSIGSMGCAALPFSRMPGRDGETARAALGQVLGKDLSTPEKIARFKIQMFRTGLMTALGRQTSSDEEAYEIAASYRGQPSAGAASYCAVGLANELRSSGDLVRADRILSHVTTLADPHWQRPHLFRIECAIEAFASTGDYSRIEYAKDCCRALLAVAESSTGPEGQQPTGTGGGSGYGAVAKDILLRLSASDAEEFNAYRRTAPSDISLGLYKIDQWTGDYETLQ